MEHTRASLVARMREQRQHIAEWFATIEDWNRLRPTEAFTLEEIDPDGLLARMGVALDLSLAREDGLATPSPFTGERS